MKALSFDVVVAVVVVAGLEAVGAIGAAVGGGSAAMKSQVSWRKKEGL